MSYQFTIRWGTWKAHASPRASGRMRVESFVDELLARGAKLDDICLCVESTDETEPKTDESSEQVKNQVHTDDGPQG